MDGRQAIGVLLFFTTICSYINYRFIKLPKPIGITLIALLITISVNIYSLINMQVNEFAQSLIDNLGFKETVLHGMLGFLIFAGSLHINTLELSKHKYLIALFATLSVLISTILLGFATYGITLLIGIPIPLCYCIVFGALISPTDAIAVISVLKTSKLPKTVELKIVGEALLNDGMGIALFFMALAIAYGHEKSIDSVQALMYFVREAGGGILLGLAIGLGAAKLLATIEVHELSIILTLALVSGGYILSSSVFMVSGPICMAITGLMVGTSLKNYSTSKDCRRRVEEFWDLLDALLNAMLFVLIGLEFIRIDIQWQIALASFAVIIASIVIRWISLFIPTICLAPRQKLNINELTIMAWGGLRGGISIALALSVNGPYRDNILTLTYFVVLSSIIAQGLTIKPMVSKLKL